MDEERTGTDRVFSIRGSTTVLWLGDKYSKCMRFCKQIAFLVMFQVMWVFHICYEQGTGSEWIDSFFLSPSNGFCWSKQQYRYFTRKWNNRVTFLIIVYFIKM